MHDDRTWWGERRTMDVLLLTSIAPRFCHGADLAEPDLLLHRRVRRHGNRGAARARAGADDLAAAAILLHHGRRVRRHPDGRHLLRCAVWRLDHRRSWCGSRARRSSVVTCLDGYAMARQGRAGAALGIAAFGSFIAGVLVTARALCRRPRAGGFRARLRAGGVHRAGAARPAAGDAAVVGIANRRAADGRVRTPALDRRARTRSTAPSASPFTSSACSTASTSRCWPWACSASPSS